MTEFAGFGQPHPMDMGVDDILKVADSLVAKGRADLGLLLLVRLSAALLERETQEPDHAE